MADWSLSICRILPLAVWSAHVFHHRPSNCSSLHLRCVPFLSFSAHYSQIQFVLLLNRASFFWALATSDKVASAVAQLICNSPRPPSFFFISLLRHFHSSLQADSQSYALESRTEVQLQFAELVLSWLMTVGIFFRTQPSALVLPAPFFFLLCLCFVVF